MLMVKLLFGSRFYWDLGMFVIWMWCLRTAFISVIASFSNNYINKAVVSHFGIFQAWIMWHSINDNEYWWFDCHLKSIFDQDACSGVKRVVNCRIMIRSVTISRPAFVNKCTNIVVVGWFGQFQVNIPIHRYSSNVFW